MPTKERYVRSFKNAQRINANKKKRDRNGNFISENPQILSQSSELSIPSSQTPTSTTSSSLSLTVSQTGVFPPQCARELEALYDFLRTSSMGKKCYILENVRDGKFHFDDTAVINTYKFFCPIFFDFLSYLVKTGNCRDGISKEENIAQTIDSFLVQRKNFSISTPYMIKNGLLCEYGQGEARFVEARLSSKRCEDEVIASKKFILNYFKTVNRVVLERNPVDFTNFTNIFPNMIAKGKQEALIILSKYYKRLADQHGNQAAADQDPYTKLLNFLRCDFLEIALVFNHKSKTGNKDEKIKKVKALYPRLEQYQQFIRDNHIYDHNIAKKLKEFIEG